MILFQRHILCTGNEQQADNSRSIVTGALDVVTYMSFDIFSAGKSYT